MDTFVIQKPKASLCTNIRTAAPPPPKQTVMEEPAAAAAAAAIGPPIC